MIGRLMSLVATSASGVIAAVYGDDIRAAVFLAAFWIVLAMPKDTPPAARRGEE